MFGICFMLFKSLVCLLLKNNKYSSKLLCANYIVCRCVWSITIVLCSLCVVYHHCSMFAVIFDVAEPCGKTAQL